VRRLRNATWRSSSSDCSVERCPACLGQSLGCECNDDPLEDIGDIGDIDDIDVWRSIGSRDPS
jgi:hypothetical protein